MSCGRFCTFRCSPNFGLLDGYETFVVNRMSSSDIEESARNDALGRIFPPITELWSSVSKSVLQCCREVL